MILQPWHFLLMAVMYIIAGVFHFIKPKAYLPIMPPYIPAPKIMVFLSGIAEVILGVGLLFPLTKNVSIYGIALMLLVFLTVHFYMLKEPKFTKNIPLWVLWLRLPLQFLLIWWALFYL